MFCPVHTSTLSLSHCRQYWIIEVIALVMIALTQHLVRHVNCFKVKTLTCAEQQQDLHAQILVVGNLQPDELAGDLQHLLALVGHVWQLHPLPVCGIRQKRLNGTSP